MRRTEEIDSVGHFSRRKVLAYDLEEVPRGLILETRRVSHVDHDLGARECPLRAFATRRVDGRVRRSGNGINALLPQLLHDPGAEPTSAANDHDLWLHLCA